uniref:Uncharacterized protein n=1 Tax=Syphacia muris TaxID=451379 RepID=A0A0N5AS94_9BILA
MPYCLLFQFNLDLYFELKASLSSSDELTEASDEKSKSESELRKILPSEETFEKISVQLLDALIKRGQMEMAKGAFRTQLEVLRKVQPEQYKKFKKISIDQLAAEAVMEQADLAKMMPKTGNRLVDMLHENGIPIASSIKGIQQAIKTQREIEESDPAEQILKAILEKFQKQILPGIVANAIAGRNPFQMPSRQQIQQMANSEKVANAEVPNSTPFYTPKVNRIKTAFLLCDVEEQSFTDVSKLTRHLEQPEKYLKPKKIFNNPNPQPGIVIEERPIPPLVFKPKGRHTRIRFVGATEREIPGIGGRLILPSSDPTKPAVNTALQTHGKHRDEYDTMFKIPNSLNNGGTIGMHSKTKSEVFYGGDGSADMPALGV